MKKYLLFIIFSGCFSVVYAQNNQWAWMGGENGYTSAYFGTRGVADSANRPGGGTPAASWKDAFGNFWIFDRWSNNLWKYDLASKWWTWVSDDSVSRQKAVYGTRGTASPNNKPIAFTSVSWTDAAGNFWMYSNVLWKYNPAINQWTWVNGDTTVTNAVYGTKGVADAANKPGTTNSVEWTDASGNFWLYGDVLWKYDLTTDWWTWVHGDTANTGTYYNSTTVYGLKGVPSSTNTPGNRTGVTGWSDASGKFWLFGGFGKARKPYMYGLRPIYEGDLSDLWNYDPATNQWTWVSGDTTLYAYGITGTIGTAAPDNRPTARSNAVSWTDSSGNFWLFGGYINTTNFSLPWYTPIGDLWKYDRVGNLWTCLRKSYSFVSHDSFAVKGVESPNTRPASRYDATGWSDASGNLWLFGGLTIDYSNITQYHLLNDLLRYNTKTNLWSLERENKDGREYGIYGTKGVADAANLPGGRSDAVSCTDSAGNVWLFGGFGFGSSEEFPKYLNDLWKRDTAGIWTWVSGLTTTGPSARGGSAFWSDANNQLWLFGGQNDPSPFHNFNNDMWKFDKYTDQWTQVSDNSVGRYGVKGQSNAANKPTGRKNAVSWSDHTGKLWLFGGDQNYNADNQPTALNDLWNYDPAITQWRWVSGDSTKGQSGVYGNSGIPDTANKPGARQGAVSWTDATGNVWIFGGFATWKNYYFNDLWKFNILTSLWTWISGDSAVNQNGLYGTKGIAAAANKPGGRYDAVSWMDATGKLWLFGGTPVGGTGTLNDLWNYDPATNLWTWISGDSSINKNGTAGNKGVFSPANKPGTRSASVAWKDKTGNFWLMGGTGYGTKGSGFLNDLWKFTPASLALPVKFISFTAAPQNSTIVLNWQTAEEQQCAYYAIQRSHDGVSYDSIGTITATNNGIPVNNYIFTDHHPFPDVNYYRIRQVDEDGRYTYSIVRKVMINSAGFSYALGQNPVTNELKINLESNQSLQLQLEVRDAAGHLLIHQNQPIARGNIMHVIPVKQLAAGVYFLTVNSGKTSITKKFIKQ